MIHKKLLATLITALLFISCENEIKIEGKWYVVQSQSEKGTLKNQAING